MQNRNMNLENENKTIQEQEWLDMPEFIQEDMTSKRKIIIHFRNDEDVANFARIINQTITPKQKSTWFPFMENRKCAHLRYDDES